MYTNKKYFKMEQLYRQCNRNKRDEEDFMPLNFPVEDIHLIVQLPVLFNACIKLGIVIDVFPCLVPHLQACRYLLRMF